MDIIDAHHHLWDLKANHYPWLHDPKKPRVYGDHAPICRDYLLTDYFHDIADQPIVKSVHVQADHDFTDPVRETRWLQAQAARPDNPRNLPNAIVAFADLSNDNAAEILEAHAQSPNMRGIRQALNGHPDLLHHPAWRANLGLLKRFNLSFDAQMFPAQMAEFALLAGRHAEVQFILCHVGLPMDASPDGRLAWRAGMRQLADLPNLAVKISGFGMFDRQWTTESIRPLVLETIEMFGAARAMFGSNYPVDGMMASYDRIWTSFLAITASFSAAEKQAMFHDNAQHFYRLSST